MFKWFFGGKSKDEEFMAEIIKSARIGERYKKLNTALATIGNEQMTAKSNMPSASAAAILVNAITKDANIQIDNDDDRFVAGIFAFVFADYFSSLLEELFESASTIAVADVVGIEELDRCINTIVESHNNLAKTKPKILQAIGQSCAK